MKVLPAFFFLLPMATGGLHAQDLFVPLAAAPDPEVPPATETLEDITVTASPELPVTLGSQSMQPVRSVSGEALQRNARGTLGDTLGWEPGISSNSFSPGASRPVIRGFEGVRVRTLRDDLSTFDLSDLSPDHGVALEPFLLEEIEVHRGPASLLYGNSAIGGAVNARSKVLARERTGEPVRGGWESSFDTAADGWQSAGHLTLATGPLLFRFTGSARDANDIRIPGKARTAAYDETESPRYYDPVAGQELPVRNPSGHLPNSFHEGSTWSAGVSWLPQNLPLFFGVSYSRYDSRYGVPYVFEGDATDLLGDYALDLQQDRYDLEARWELGDGFFRNLEGRLGYASYRHAEWFQGRQKDLGTDFIETAFAKHSLETRLDLHHQAFDGALTGLFGISYADDSLVTRRALTPPPTLAYVRSELAGETFGLYALETLQGRAWRAQIGHRLEHVDVSDQSQRAYGYVVGEHAWSHSTSAALTWEKEGLGFLDRLAITGILSRMERLPTSTERYAFWHNAGIGRFVIGGDLDGTPLGTERSTGYELGVQAERAPFTFRLNGYYYDFDHFIFLQEDPQATGGFGRAVQYIDRAASFLGYEAELEWKLVDTEPRHVSLTFLSDMVHARNTTDREPLPRMPPWRLGSRFEWQENRFTAGLEIRYAASQQDVKPAPRAELPTDSYVLVNADLTWKLPLADQEASLFLRATNLLDEDIRLSPSFRKDVAPLPGRALVVGIRQEF